MQGPVASCECRGAGSHVYSCEPKATGNSSQTRPTPSGCRQVYTMDSHMAATHAPTDSKTMESSCAGTFGDRPASSVSTEQSSRSEPSGNTSQVSVVLSALLVFVKDRRKKMVFSWSQAASELCCAFCRLHRVMLVILVLSRCVIAFPASCQEHSLKWRVTWRTPVQPGG